MRTHPSTFLGAVLGSTALLALAGCGGGGGGGGGGGSIPIGAPIPFLTPNEGVIGFASIGGHFGSIAAWGGQGTDGVISVRNGTGDYTITFTGTFIGVTSASDVTVLATAAHTTHYNVACASMDEGSANAAEIVVHVITYSTAVFPDVREDADFSVMVTRGAGAVGVAGFANIEGEGLIAEARSFGGDETTRVIATRRSLGRYTVTFEGSFPGVASMDDLTVLVAVNDDDGFEIAAASVDGGSADSAHVTFQVSAWSTLAFPPALIDTSFSVLILRRGATPPAFRGFASVNGDIDRPAVQNFGGSETAWVFVTQPLEGCFIVTFLGTYSDVVDASDVTVLAAVSDDDNYNVASVGNVVATPTAITVTVWVWSTKFNPRSVEDHDFAVVIPR